MRIGIIGLGIVGEAIRSVFGEKHEVFVHDPKLGTQLTDVTASCDVAYIAVPTPTDGVSNKCDTGIVRSVLEELPDGFSAVIKSTVVPGTTEKLQEDFPNLKIACSPEFLRAASAEEDFRNQGILVVGTNDQEFARLILEHHTKAGIMVEEAFYHVSPTQAEIAKYAKNAFYSIKVIFGNQFQELSRHHDEDWGAIKEILTHPHQNSIVDSHLDEIPGEMGFGGGCLPKDTLAIITELRERGLDYELLQSLLNDNKRIRGEEGQ